jgi:hypothetical protein
MYMNFTEDFSRAIEETEVHRGRRSRLLTVGSTELPYILLNRSLVHKGDTVVRRGVLKVEEPAIMLMQRPHQFEGFGDESGDPNEALVAIGRLARFPPARYTNREVQMDVEDKPLDAVLRDLDHFLDENCDERTGLISGPVEIWHLSLMVYVGHMIRQSAGGDFTDLIKRLREP